MAAMRYSSLWHMILPPVVWAVHFVTVYSLTAVFCARLGAPLTARLWTGALTVVALALIVWLGWHAWHQWEEQSLSRALDAPTDQHRDRFLGHVAWLLALISAIGVVFTALPALLIAGCL